jgi:hypothetical protein
MSKRIQSRVFAFGGVTFPIELSARTLVLKTTRFVSIIIVGFDPIVAEVGDIVVGGLNASYFMKAALWLKTRSDFNGR